MGNRDSVVFKGKARTSFVIKTKIKDIPVRKGTMIKQYINDSNDSFYLVIGRVKVLVEILVTPPQQILDNCIPGFLNTFQAGRFTWM